MQLIITCDRIKLICNMLNWAINGSVDRVLITGLRNELSGNVMNEKMVSNFTGILLVKIDIRAIIVTVIEAKKLVIRTAPSRIITL